MLRQSFLSQSVIVRIGVAVFLLASGSSPALAQRASSWLPDRGFPEIDLISKTKQTSAEACRNLCLKNSKCEAWSFNSGFIGSSVCALSSSGIITMMQDRGSIAGFTRAADLPRESEPIATPVVSGPQRASSWLTDTRPGMFSGDIPTTKQPSAESCRNRCLQNPDCKAWSFRYASRGPGGETEIKDCRFSTKWYGGFAEKGVIGGEIIDAAAETPKASAASVAPVVGGPQRTSSWLTDTRFIVYSENISETKQASADVCRDLCLKNLECKGWTFNPTMNGVYPKLCVLSAKTRASMMSEQGSGIITGVINEISTEASKPITTPVAADPGRRVALVIGNSAYKAVAALPNPRRDADTIAAALRRTGFQSVTVANDLTREKLIDALRIFAAEAEKADWAMVYFAGHGIEIGGVNYLIPVDAKLAADRDVQFEAVPLEQVMGAAEGAKKFRLVLLDACRDNPFAGQMRRTVATRSIGRGLAQVEPDSGTLVVYAAKHGQTALDGDGANSPFVSALVKRLATPGLEIRKLFDLVRDDVMSATNRRQQPYSYGSVPGSEDFFFVATK